MEKCSGSTSSSDIHNIPSFGKDFETVLKLLIDENVMEPQQGRFHPSFTFEKGILLHYMKDELLKRIRTTMKGIFDFYNIFHQSILKNKQKLYHAEHLEHLQLFAHISQHLH